MSDTSSSIAPTSEGLTTEEARRLLSTIGANSVPDVEPTPWRRAIEKFWAPVPWMLEAAILLHRPCAAVAATECVAYWARHGQRHWARDVQPGFLQYRACIGYFRLGLQNHGLRTLAAVTLVCSSQATFYVVRERRHLWSSCPSAWIILSSLLDISLIALLAGYGILMHALPWTIIASVFGCSAVFALILDLLKTQLISRLGDA